MSVHLMIYDLEVWKTILNELFMPTFVNDFDVILNKLKDQGTNAKSKKVKYDMKEQNIPTASLGIDEY